MRRGLTPRYEDGGTWEVGRPVERVFSEAV
jgi:hypothetical protein